MMAGGVRGLLLGLVLLVAGCGLFGGDEERLEGERIPVRAAVSGAVMQPAAPAAPAAPAPALPESEDDAEAN